MATSVQAYDYTPTEVGVGLKAAKRIVDYRTDVTVEPDGVIPDKDYPVKAEVTAAGFIFEGESPVLKNPADAQYRDQAEQPEAGAAEADVAAETQDRDLLPLADNFDRK